MKGGIPKCRDGEVEGADIVDKRPRRAVVTSFDDPADRVAFREVVCVGEAVGVDGSRASEVENERLAIEIKPLGEVVAINYVRRFLASGGISAGVGDCTGNDWDSTV